LIIAVLLLVGAVGLCLMRPGWTASFLKVGLPCLGLVWLAVRFTSPGVSTPGELWIDDAISRTVGVISCVSLLLLGLIESSPALSAALFWSAGLVCLSATAQLPAIQWAAVLGCTLPILFYGRTKTGQIPGILSRHPTLMLGCGLFTLGFWLLVFVDRIHPAATIAMILLICGLGGLLGWFPFPRAGSLAGDESSPAAILSRRLFPSLTAGIVLLRMAEQNPWEGPQMVLLALAAGFSLTLCGARLLKEERLSSRLVLSSLSLFGFLLFAVCLRNWEAQNASRDWVATSNLPGGAALFSSIAACEIIGLLAFVCGLQLLHSSQESHDFSQTLSGAASRRPLSGVAITGSLFSLAGLPPFPGFWWRLGLVSACLLPHRQSNVTQVMEADQTFAIIALLLAGLLILNSIGHLQLLQRLLFEEAFRLRSGQTANSTRCVVVLGVFLLVGIACVPLSIGPILVGGIRQDRSVPTMTQTAPAIDNEHVKSGGPSAD